MKKKDFNAIAEILADNREGVEAVAFSRMVSQFAAVCRENSDRFDRDRFTRACYSKTEVAS